MLKKLWQWFINFFRPKTKIIIIPVEKKTEDIIPSNPWKVVMSVDPGDMDHIIQVIYTNEVGMQSVETCMAIFESGTEFKLVAPELGSGKILQKANLVDLQIEKVMNYYFEKD